MKWTMFGGIRNFTVAHDLKFQRSDQNMRRWVKRTPSLRTSSSSECSYCPRYPAGSSERKCVFCDKFYMVNWFDGLPFRRKTTNMAVAVSIIGYHFSEKELIKKKVSIFILEPARLLGACKLGSRARMDSRTGGNNPNILIWAKNSPPRIFIFYSVEEINDL